ncbi:hypothetical protein [Aureispira anguillae]|uniref:Uncharacterized protein n=1 Tax=Aureispira anguillae TaxID=2864201 RepID=A0A916DXQ2_9BACT|nr:hypothetical protein [Aureispira anguillae]BDS15296.1 hypothetical protein AsAng_0060800 [Aureispira anguillae]
MNKTNFKQIWLLLLICFVTSSTTLIGQGNNNPEKPKKVRVAKNGNSAAAIAVQLSGMTREEKNTMSRCPLHNKHMSLSDNYRADASDYTPGDEYPFAYQLNYRRYCASCTRIMEKEAKNFEAEDRAANEGKQTFERCPVHNSSLKGNPDQDKVDYEKNPSPDMPHAKQYLFKNYCKICTKVYKIQHQ